MPERWNKSALPRGSGPFSRVRAAVAVEEAGAVGLGDGEACHDVGMRWLRVCGSRE